MLNPSYSELMDVIKQGEKMDSRVTSRYTVVLAAAKRARQLTDGANPLTYAPTDRAVSIAVKEMHEAKLRIRVNENLLNEDFERVMRDRQMYRTTISRDDLREDLKQDYSPVTYTDEDDEIYPTPDSDSDAEETAKPEVKKEEEDYTLYEDSEEEIEPEPAPESE